MKAPKLRFPGFEDEWSENKLGGIAEIKDSARISNAFWVTKGIPYLRSSDLVNDELHGELFISKETYAKYSSQTGAPQKGDLLFTSGGKVGVTYHKEDESEVYVQGGAVLYVRTSTSEYLDGSFLNIYFSSHKMKKYMENASVGGTIKHFTLSPANATPIIYPSIKEQQKIGSLFNLINKKIQLQQEKIDLLKEQKKGLIQKIFTQELRFKDEDGTAFPAWKENKLSSYLIEHKVRNFEGIFTKKDVLSVSGEYGVVNQIKFQGRSFAGESVSNYHVVHKGDIVYTKSPLKSNPYGIIKCNKGADGIVSTMYAVYSCKENIDGEFLDYYFQLDDHTNSYLRPLVNKGAKNDMKVNNQAVLLGTVTFPSVIEQNKIVSFLSKLDVKISLVEQKLHQLQAQKNYFMQQMFI